MLKGSHAVNAEQLQAAAMSFSFTDRHWSSSSLACCSARACTEIVLCIILFGTQSKLPGGQDTACLHAKKLATSARTRAQ